MDVIVLFFIDRFFLNSKTLNESNSNTLPFINADAQFCYNSKRSEHYTFLETIEQEIDDEKDISHLRDMGRGNP